MPRLATSERVARQVHSNDELIPLRGERVPCRIKFTLRTLPAIPKYPRMEEKRKSVRR
jgi:hypothetical protein